MDNCQGTEKRLDMGRSTIDLSDLASAIMSELMNYTNDVITNIDMRSLEIAKEAVKALKKTSPKGKRKGVYAKHWKYTTSRNIGVKSQIKEITAREIFVDAPEYRLTHLLEHGHLTRTGTRTRPMPHIEPAEKIAIENFVKAVEEAILNG